MMATVSDMQWVKLRITPYDVGIFKLDHLCRAFFTFVWTNADPLAIGTPSAIFLTTFQTTSLAPSLSDWANTNNARLAATSTSSSSINSLQHSTENSNVSQSRNNLVDARRPSTAGTSCDNRATFRGGWCITNEDGGGDEGGFALLMPTVRFTLLMYNEWFSYNTSRIFIYFQVLKSFIQIHSNDPSTNLSTDAPVRCEMRL